MNATNMNAKAVGLETISGEKIGRDPRGMTTAELQQLGHTSNSVLAAVRKHCVDCCGAQVAEVRKWRCYTCRTHGSEGR